MSTKTSALRHESSAAALAQRYRVLTLALLEAVRTDHTDEMPSLISERSGVLDALEHGPLGPDSRTILKECLRLDREVAQAMSDSQKATVNHLVGTFKGRQGSRHYRKPDASAPTGAFFAEG